MLFAPGFSFWSPNLVWYILFLSVYRHFCLPPPCYGTDYKRLFRRHQYSLLLCCVSEGFCVKGRFYFSGILDRLWLSLFWLVTDLVLLPWKILGFLIVLIYIIYYYFKYVLFYLWALENAMCGYRNLPLPCCSPEEASTPVAFINGGNGRGKMAVGPRILFL